MRNFVLTALALATLAWLLVAAVLWPLNVIAVTLVLILITLFTKRINT